MSIELDKEVDIFKAVNGKTVLKDVSKYIKPSSQNGQLLSAKLNQAKGDPNRSKQAEREVEILTLGSICHGLNISERELRTILWHYLDANGKI